MGRLILYGAAVAGVALVVLGVTAEETSLLLIIVGAIVLLITLPLVIMGIRLRAMSPEDRQARLDAMTDRLGSAQEPGSRLRKGHKEAKKKKPILANGIDGTATIVSLTFGGRANTYHSLVLMELEVSAPGHDPYLVDTGEYVSPAGTGSLAPGNELVVKIDPSDPQKVAVDWDQSLRLR